MNSIFHKISSFSRIFDKEIHHHHSRFNRHSKESNISHPDCRAEFETQNELKPHASDKSKRKREDQDQCRRKFLEFNVEKKQDDEDTHRENDHQSLSRLHFILILAAPGDKIARGQIEFFLDYFLGLVDKIDNTDFIRVHIDEHSHIGESILPGNLGRTFHFPYFCQLAERNLGSDRSGHIDFFQGIEAVPELPHIANSHRITLSSFHRGGDVHSAYSCHD